MGDNEQVSEQVEGKVDEPEPDPWAGRLQLGSILLTGAGAAGQAGETQDDVATGSIALLPHPNEIFTGAAQILGFQPGTSDVWTWGLVLIIIGLVLNIISFFLYRRSANARTAWQRATQRAVSASAKPPAQGIRRDA